MKGSMQVSGPAPACGSGAAPDREVTSKRAGSIGRAEEDSALRVKRLNSSEKSGE